MKTHHLMIGASTLVAGAIAAALILRPTRSIRPGPEMGIPQNLSPVVAGAINAKMQHHGQRLTALISRAVLLDYDGAARPAGEIFDDPGLVRSGKGEELNGALPEQFWELQATLRKEAKEVVEASALRDPRRLSEPPRP